MTEAQFGLNELRYTACLHSQVIHVYTFLSVRVLSSAKIITFVCYLCFITKGNTISKLAGNLNINVCISCLDLILYNSSFLIVFAIKMILKNNYFNSLFQAEYESKNSKFCQKIH